MKTAKENMSNRYKCSEELLERALRTVPLGSQTFSKSKTQLPYGVSPYFASKAAGAYMWDVDGNKYIDFANSLCAVTLGYNDPDVTSAVRAQLEKGVIFSLAHEIEFLVAEKICEMVPCAEKVRFGKNGSDATAGAIRLSRAFTGRDHVIVSGYHGWQDWYIGSTGRNLGVPQATRDLTHPFIYNDIESLERLFVQYKGKVACVIMEPSNVQAPKDNFLEEVKRITHENDAVLIFDETITGFRYANGGAQEFYGVTPDLATFGKGLANGFPVSAVAGRADIMNLMEEIFFSFTFGGETLSLAASLATLTKLQEQPVVKHMYDIGSSVMSKVEEAINLIGLDDVFNVSGHPSWSFFNMKDVENISAFELKTLFIQEMFAKGVFSLGTHNISYAHTTEHVDLLLDVYRIFLDKVSAAINDKDIRQFLLCEPLVPLFKVR